MSWKKYTREGGGKFLKKIRKNNLPSEKEDFCSKEKKTTRFLQMHFFSVLFQFVVGSPARSKRGRNFVFSF